MALFGRPSERDDQRAQAHARWVNERNPLAIASTVLGVFSLIEFGAIPVFGIGGVILGIIALRQLKQPDALRRRGHGLAWTGIVASATALAIGAALYMHRFLAR